MKRVQFLYSIFIFSLTFAIYGQTTYVPDDNFEQKLIDLGYDDVLDDYVLTANIVGVENLYIHNLGIADITGVEDFQALKILRCQNNQLTSLDITQNIALIVLYCWNNQLTDLNLSQNPALQELDCANNNLTALDVSQNTTLHFLHCPYNAITSLDVSFSDIGWLHCDSNQLTTLNVTSMHGGELYTVNNPDLFCIQIDEGFVPNPNEWEIDNHTQLASDCITTTYVPDDNFEQELINYGYDSIMDDYVYTSNISGLDDLFLNNLNISDLTGIEDFIALTYLSCSDNLLTSIDISQNTALTNFQCQSNQLTSLNVSENPLLEILYCYGNQMTNLDVSLNPNLLQLKCDNNQLTTLDVSNGNNANILEFSAVNNQDLFCIQIDLGFVPNISLWTKDSQAEYSFDCSNDFTYIPDDNFEQELINLGYDDVLDDIVLRSNISGVVGLNLNGLGIIDLTGIEDFEALSVLSCNMNQINTLDVSQNTNLIELQCSNNQLTTLDLSQNTVLTVLNCDANLLSTLNVSNGNNENFTMVSTVNNTDLSCIQIDENFVPDSNWIQDDHTQYSVDCTFTYVPDDIFEQKLIDLGYDNVLDDFVLSLHISAVTEIDLNNLGISDLTGIEDFMTLELLECNGNNLPILDVSQNTNLIELHCNNNVLTSLDVSQNTNLISLSCNNNMLSLLDVSFNTGLIDLICDNNQINNLDVSPNIVLEELTCNDNDLTSLNLTNNNNVNMNFVSAYNNPNLFCIQIDEGFTPDSNWVKDPQAVWSIDCDLSIPTANIDHFKIFPNPVKNILNISNISLSSSLKIYDVFGKKLLSLQALNQIDLSFLESGFYFISISNEIQSQTFKIIKN